MHGPVPAKVVGRNFGNWRHSSRCCRPPAPPTNPDDCRPPAMSRLRSVDRHSCFEHCCARRRLDLGPGQSKGPQVSTHGPQSPGVIGGEDVTVNYGAPSTPQAGPSPTQAPGQPRRAEQRTQTAVSPPGYSRRPSQHRVPPIQPRRRLPREPTERRRSVTAEVAVRHPETSGELPGDEIANLAPQRLAFGRQIDRVETEGGAHLADDTPPGTRLTTRALNCTKGTGSRRLRYH